MSCLSHTWQTTFLNLQCINTQTRRHNHNGASNRLSHVKVRRQGPQRGNFAVSLPRTILCRAAEEVLELSEESVAEVLLDARQELMQMFDESVGMTGTVELAELDGPFVKLRLQGRFWHKKADVLARVAAYLRRRIPDVMEIDIEDESQLDDSAANF